MEKMQFDSIRWHKGMKAEIEVRAITRGTIRKSVDIVGVDFASENITLFDGIRYYHRAFNQITIID